VSKKIDMSAFVGRDFDCEFYLGIGCGPDGQSSFPIWAIAKAMERRGDRVVDTARCLSTDIFRPRLNKPQVLDGWSWVPDGFVWEVFCLIFSGKTVKHKIISEQLREIEKEDSIVIVWAECIGIESNAGYDHETKRLDMPLVEV